MLHFLGITLELNEKNAVKVLVSQEFYAMSSFTIYKIVALSFGGKNEGTIMQPLLKIAKSSDLVV